MTCILNSADGVGESIVWCERTSELLWVDISGRRIHRFHPASGVHRVKRTTDMPTSIGLTEEGGGIVGFLREVALWDLHDRFDVLARVEEHLPKNRLNEGRVAPDGSFWVGTMQNNLDAEGRGVAISGRHGSIYRISGSGEVFPLTDPEFSITNTFVWLDHKFVTADTTANALYEYDSRDGRELRNRQSFGSAYAKGLPDGSCLDAEGFIWNCRVAGGACLVRFAPDGKVDREVAIGCTSPTSCAFGGKDLATLYVTSARFGLDAAQIDANPEEGGLFALDVGIRGRPTSRFRYDS